MAVRFPALFRARRARDDLRAAFGGERGQRALVWILRQCGHGQDPHEPGVPDQTMVNVGKQTVATTIVRTMNLSDADLERMREAARRQEESLIDGPEAEV